MILVATLVVFPALMAFAAASDLLTMTIPNKLSLTLVGSFAVLALCGGLSLDVIAWHAAAAALVLLVCFTLFACGWIGGGDAKLAAATSLWLGFGTLPEYLFVASLGGGVLTALVLLLRRAPLPRFALGWTWLSRIHDPKSGVPYGIALAAAALVVYPHTELWSAVLSR